MIGKYFYVPPLLLALSLLLYMVCSAVSELYSVTWTMHAVKYLGPLHKGIPSKMVR
jgi:hypothetical protein